MEMIKKIIGKKKEQLPKYKTIHVLNGDYLVFKALCAHQKVMQRELFPMLLRCYVEELKYNYREENKKLRDNVSKLLAIIWQYERKYGKLFDQSAKRAQNVTDNGK